MACSAPTRFTRPLAWFLAAITALAVGFAGGGPATAAGGISLESSAVRDALDSGTLTLPDPSGRPMAFRVSPYAVAAPALRANHPETRVWSGVGAHNPRARIVADVGPLGFSARVIEPGRTWSVDRHPDGSPRSATLASAGTGAAGEDPLEASGASRRLAPRVAAFLSSGTELRTYRFAMAATGEWSHRVFQYAGLTRAQIAALTTGEKKALVHNAQVRGLAVVNTVLETEVSARLVLVPNNDDLIYLDAATDPYPAPSNATDAFLSPNRTTLDTVIGNANYDLGHVVATVSGGKAYRGVIGDTTYKAQGVSGVVPLDQEWIDLFAHEVGHQFGANHTFQGCDQTYASQAYEPGSGSTIMSYAGTCADDDLQGFADPQFHAASYAEMRTEMQSVPGVGVGTATGNQIPAVTVVGGTSFTVPPLTPLRLAATATDPDSPDTLTYAWEQMDNGALRVLDQSTKTGGALFRTRRPSTSGVRYLPSLQAVLAGTTNIATGTCTGVPADADTGEPRLSCWGEFLPTAARSMNFRVTVRDNAPGGGGVSNADVAVTAAGTDRFRVTSHTAPETLTPGESTTITWDTAGTSAAPYSVDDVDILLSTDGGATWTRTLAAGTPNDGSETITVPAISVVGARIMVRPVGNIFYAVSDAGVTIDGAGAPTAPIVASATPGPAQATVAMLPGPDGGVPASYVVTASPGGRTCAITGASGSCVVTGLTNGVPHTFSATATNPSGTSPASAASAPTTPIDVPGEARSVTVTPGHRHLRVTWEPPASDGGSPISSYYLSISGNSSKYCSVPASALQLSCELTGLTNGTQYQVWMYTYNDVGKSVTWAPARVAPRDWAPLAPTSVSASGGDGNATVAWTLPADNMGSALTGQTVTATPGGQSCTVTDPAATSCVVTGLTNGTAYTFTVAATNAAGTSPASTASAAVTPQQVLTQPGTPAVTSTVAGNAQVAVTVSPGPGGAPTSYLVTADPGGNTCTVTGALGTCTVTGLSNGTAYTFSATATNALGISGGSDPSAPVTPATAPDPPTTLTASAGNATAVITWSPPGANGGATITGYTVTASPGGRTCTASGASATSCTVTGLTNGTTYTFTATATNARGTSNPSLGSSPIVPRSAPGRPTDVTATGGDAEVSVRWQAPADTGGSAITGYTATAQPGGRSCTSALAAVTSCTIAGLTNGTPYTVTVVAHNAVGSSVASVASIPATPGSPVQPAPPSTPAPSAPAPQVPAPEVPTQQDRAPAAPAVANASGPPTTPPARGGGSTGAPPRPAVLPAKPVPAATVAKWANLRVSAGSRVRLTVPRSSTACAVRSGRVIATGPGVCRITATVTTGRKVTTRRITLRARAAG